MEKKMILGAMGAAGAVALLSIVDMAFKVPFGGYSLAMDLMYLVAAGIVLYMGFETHREMK